MKDPKIVEAYDRLAPDEAVKARMLRRILEKKDAQTAKTPGRSPLRIILPIAAAIALVAALSIGGFAARGNKWRLPEPESYTPDPENGSIISVHDTNKYDAPPAEGDTVLPLSDEDFLRKTVEFLRSAGFADVELRDLTVARQKNLYWDREETEVYFDREGIKSSVRFDSESGYLIGFTGIDYVTEEAAACTSQAEADALALSYYQRLPVPQGYVQVHCEQYDEQYWTYDYCREVEPGIFNQYEMARISINPVSGQLVGCRVFYVPLLDDHEPGDHSLTQAEAEAVIADRLPEGMVLRKAEMPRPPVSPDGAGTWNTSGRIRNSPTGSSSWWISTQESFWAET